MGSNGLKRPIFGQKCRFGAKFGCLCPVVTRTWFCSRSEFLLLKPKISDFGPKIHFLLLGPGFRQWTVCSPRKDGPFRTFGSIFRLKKTAIFVKKKNWLTRQKVFPHPTMGAPSAASNSPSALSERAGWLQLLQWPQWLQWLHWLQWVTDTWANWI